MLGSTWSYLPYSGTIYVKVSGNSVARASAATGGRTTRPPWRSLPLNSKSPTEISGCLPWSFNSLDPGKCGSNFEDINFELIIRKSRCAIALTWKPQNSTNEKSTLVKTRVWCRHVASHCLPKFIHMALLGHRELTIYALSCVSSIYAYIQHLSDNTIWCPFYGETVRVV